MLLNDSRRSESPVKALLALSEGICGPGKSRPYWDEPVPRLGKLGACSPTCDNQDLPALFGVASVTGLISSEGQETPVRIAFFAHCRA